LAHTETEIVAESG